MNPIRLADDPNPGGLAPQEVAVGVRVQRDVHFADRFVHLLEGTDRRVERRVLPPGADERVEIMVFAGARGRKAMAKSSSHTASRATSDWGSRAMADSISAMVLTGANLAGRDGNSRLLKIAH